MLGVNLGTGTIADAAALVEYCNAPTGTRYADLRAAHGYPEPHAVRYWCVGNEMDGPWQIGHLEADEYARKAREAAKVMRWQDPAVKLIVCGSSNTVMPDLPGVGSRRAGDMLGARRLPGACTTTPPTTTMTPPATWPWRPSSRRTSIPWPACCAIVKSKLRSRHSVKLSWDEWNVWYKDTSGRGGWQEAPPLSEEVYNLEDALVVAQWLNVFLRRCDVLEIACLAQIVNTISPLTTTPDRLLRQTTFYPFALVGSHAAGTSLDALTIAPLYETKLFGPMPLLDVSASYDAAGDHGAVFLVNRSQQEPVTTDIAWHGAAPSAVSAIYQLSGTDPKAVNTFEQPDTIVPVRLGGMPVQDGRITLRLPPLSFTVVTTEGYRLDRV